MNRGELTSLLHDPASALYRLLTIWSQAPMLLMFDIDWTRGPLVLVGKADQMLWPLVPAGSILQLDQSERTIDERQYGEFDRPMYLVEYRGRFHCCHAQRRGDTLRMISHFESPERPSITVPSREARVRGRLTTIFRPLATRGNLAGRPEYLKPGRHY